MQAVAIEAGLALEIALNVQPRILDLEPAPAGERASATSPSARPESTAAIVASNSSRLTSPLLRRSSA